MKKLCFKDGSTEVLKCFVIKTLDTFGSHPNNNCLPITSHGGNLANLTQTHNISYETVFVSML